MQPFNLIEGLFFFILSMILFRKSMTIKKGIIEEMVCHINIFMLISINEIEPIQLIKKDI